MSSRHVLVADATLNSQRNGAWESMFAGSAP